MMVLGKMLQLLGSVPWRVTYHQHQQTEELWDPGAVVHSSHHGPVPADVCLGVLPSSCTAVLTRRAPAMGGGGAQTEGILLVSGVLASAGG